MPSERDVREVADAYNHFFFHYAATPLLVVETSQVDPAWDDAAVDEVLQQVQSMPGGTPVLRPARDWVRAGSPALRAGRPSRPRGLV